MMKITFLKNHAEGSLRFRGGWNYVLEDDLAAFILARPLVAYPFGEEPPIAAETQEAMRRKEDAERAERVAMANLRGARRDRSEALQEVAEATETENARQAAELLEKRRGERPAREG